MEMNIKEQLLTVSGGDTGIGYGGIDTTGEPEPAGRDDAGDLLWKSVFP
jgi:hypothetical protein